MKSINQFRRKAVMIGIAAPVLLFVPGISLAETSEPIPVDVTGVTNVPSLILAIKKAAGGLLPESVKDKEFRAEIAKIFAKNARAAAERGYRIPHWVLNKLPNRRVVLPILGIAIFTIYNVTFAIPVATIIAAVLLSIVIMTAAISAAINAMVKEAKAKTKI